MSGEIHYDLSPIHLPNLITFPNTGVYSRLKGGSDKNLMT